MSFRGPIEDGEWVEAWTARVVKPGPAPRVRGYDLDGDLALHYGWSERTFLTHRGRLPSPEESRDFERSLAFVSAASVDEGPTAAASIARLAGARPAGFVVSVISVLAEEAQSLVVEGASGEGPLFSPSRVKGFLAGLSEERRAVIEEESRLPVAVRRCWEALGFTKPEAWVELWCLSRLPAVLAEAFAVRPGSFRQVPMRTPDFEYQEMEA
ncbi:MAG: hypothetical protein AAGD10_00530 [Myxococcota bacterium]